MKIYVFIVLWIFCLIAIYPSLELTGDVDEYKKCLVISKDGNATLVVPDPLFPNDIFTLEEKRRGAVIIHIFAVVYMFLALAIVCDDYFVPSLEVIAEVLNISHDVAGATFMAAGGSAPELFTSIIGVFVSFDDVGIGTIVGSAVFNILFVIACCAVFACSDGKVLALTWWPLFRDCIFYAISLLTLIACFEDNSIKWYESLIMLSLYFFYVTFMWKNVQIERFVKERLLGGRVTRVRSSDQLMGTPQITTQVPNSGNSATYSEEISESTSSTNRRSSSTSTKFKDGLLVLMAHSIDPMYNGHIDERAGQLHAMVPLKAILDADKPKKGFASTSAALRIEESQVDANGTVMAISSCDPSAIENESEEEDDDEEPIKKKPTNFWETVRYIIIFPINFLLWATLPNAKKESSRKLVVITFIGSIIWIALFSYLMVWWTSLCGATFSVPNEVMGLTILAAGTSVPDLITSVIVAKKGHGDMAVSSSVGSNIFDVTIGLPFPWLIYSIIKGCPVTVSSVGMVCSITLLFLMLLFVVISIALFDWKLNLPLGFVMMMLYFVFLTFSLLFEYQVINCPF